VLCKERRHCLRKREAFAAWESQADDASRNSYWRWMASLPLREPEPTQTVVRGLIASQRNKRQIVEPSLAIFIPRFASPATPFCLDATREPVMQIESIVPCREQR